MMTKTEANAKAKRTLSYGHHDDGRNTYAFCPDCNQRVYGYYQPHEKRPARQRQLREQLVEHLVCGCEDGWGTTR
jgi:hypothetical protein